MTPRSCEPTEPVPPLADPTEELARLASALGHPARVRILRFLLAREECFAGAIVDHLPLAQSTVSQHLKVLREAGLVRGEVEGPRVSYCADRQALERMAGLVHALGLGHVASLEEPAGSNRLLPRSTRVEDAAMGAHR
jgi:ArsR family transcriptional regulator, arsenate/arsenite/antimonite-responsive transcriptional repressor